MHLEQQVQLETLSDYVYKELQKFSLKAIFFCTSQTGKIINGGVPGSIIHVAFPCCKIAFILLPGCCCCSCWVTSVVSDSVQPHRWKPTRLPCPWDSPGKNTGVGCHFFLQCMKVKSEREVAPSCPTLSDPMDCSPPGSSIHGIFQARVLEWGTIAFFYYLVRGRSILRFFFVVLPAKIAFIQWFRELIWGFYHWPSIHSRARKTVTGWVCDSAWLIVI